MDSEYSVTSSRVKIEQLEDRLVIKMCTKVLTNKLYIHFHVACPCSS